MEMTKRILLPLLLVLLICLCGCRRRILEAGPADITILVTEPTEPPTEEPTEGPTEAPTEPESSTQTEPETEAEDETEPTAPESAPETVPVTSPVATQPVISTNPTAPASSEPISSDSPTVPEPTEMTEETEPSEPTEPVSVTVLFNANKGVCEVESAELIQGQPFGELPPAGREGYTFTGWYPGRFGGEAVTAATIVTQSETFTLYAHWSETPAYTLTFDGNGGRIHPSDRTRTVYDGFAYNTMPTPVRDGYDFLGWFTGSSDGEQVLAEDLFHGTEDMTLYAHWAYNPYAFWSFTLQNIREQMYSCQELSVYVEFDASNVTVSYCPLLNATKCQNAAQYRDDMNVTDEWVQERNPAWICKIISDMGNAASVYAEMKARFPGKPVLIVPSAAVYGSDAQVLYYQLLFGKTLYPSWYTAVDPVTVGAELGVSGGLYG